MRIGYIYIEASRDEPTAVGFSRDRTHNRAQSCVAFDFLCSLAVVYFHDNKNRVNCVKGIIYRKEKKEK